MRKSMLGLSMAIALVIFSCTSCTSNSPAWPAKQEVEGQTVDSGKAETTGGTNSPEAGAANGASKGSSSQTTSQTTPAASEQSVGAANSGVTVISKSDNVYTDAQKQQTLTELQGEIDKLIESINNLDEAQDSQLTFDE